jgi:O-antigen ligase
MRLLAQAVLTLFVFTIPWEYSLDYGEPLGNVARIVGLVLVLVAVPAVLRTGSLRTPGAVQWASLAFFLGLCCSAFWSIEPGATFEKMRGFPQEAMIVWLAWELIDDPAGLRTLLRAYVAGSWVLALLTLANFGSLDPALMGETRLVAAGQDPNDVARFLDLGLPVAAMLAKGEDRWPGRLLVFGFLPLGSVAVLLTASRAGFLAGLVALAGCAALLFRSHTRAVLAGALALPAAAAVLLWFVVPHEIFERLATIPEQLQSGDLNQRLNIWIAGWHAFLNAPIFGSGAGTFVQAAGLAQIDTAHNTLLSIAVNGGLCALFLASIILALVLRSILQIPRALQLGMALALLVWGITSLVSTVEESRTTWLLFALAALAGRLAAEMPERFNSVFSPGLSQRPDSVTGAAAPDSVRFFMG